jgi:integrase
MSVKIRPYRRGGWEVDILWRDPEGRRRRERTRTSVTSKAAAKRWGEARERELILRGPAPRRKEVPTLGEFAPRFLDEHARANRQKPGGIAQKEVVLRVHLVPLLGKKRLDAIVTADVQQLKHHLQTKAPKTVNNVLTVLSTMLKKALEWGVIDAMPCVVKLLKVSEGSVDFYDFDEYEQMVEAARQVGANAHLIVLLGGEAGLRGGEMRALEWRDINLKEGRLRVERNDWRGQVTTTKGNRVRYVPLTRRLATALAKYRHLRGPRVISHPDGEPLAEYEMTDLLAKVGRRAKVRSNGPHILRHTFCSHLAMRGAPARAIQELAGHRDLTTTQKYMHLSASAVADAIRLLDAPKQRGDGVETGSAETKEARKIDAEVVSPEGIEPSTNRLRVCCSAS